MGRLKTTDEFIAEAIEIHGDKYNYSQTIYKLAVEKVTITCKLHGDFKIKPNNHLSAKQGCAKCSGNVKYTTEEFVNKATNIHNGKYLYPNVVYTSAHGTMRIQCSVHGAFEQQAYVHLQGHGCPTCGSLLTGLKNIHNPDIWSYRGWEEAGNTSQQFDSFKLYVIRCTSLDEEFIKIGKTFMKLHRRFSGQVSMPYATEVLHTISSDASAISLLEVEVHQALTEYRITPLLQFNGCKECYTAECLPSLNIKLSNIKLKEDHQ